MEKLIELLNESEDWFVSHFVSYDDLNWVFRLNSWQSFHYTLILSKEYWFIKWLVDNDKIDFYKVNEVYYKKVYYWTDWKYVSYAKFLDEEILIMRLSIQDNPIEFLCEILK